MRNNKTNDFPTKGIALWDRRPVDDGWKGPPVMRRCVRMLPTCFAAAFSVMLATAWDFLRFFVGLLQPRQLLRVGLHAGGAL